MAVLAGEFAVICSFVGLCAGIRVRFAVHRCFAPLMAASGIIVILSFAAMLNALLPACLALYALGFVSLAYAWGFSGKRNRGERVAAQRRFLPLGNHRQVHADEGSPARGER